MLEVRDVDGLGVFSYLVTLSGLSFSLDIDSGHLPHGVWRIKAVDFSMIGTRVSKQKFRGLQSIFHPPSIIMEMTASLFVSICYFCGSKFPNTL